MANVNAAYGLIPLRHSSGNAPRANKYTIVSGLAENIFTGDLCILDANGQITPHTATEVNNIEVNNQAINLSSNYPNPFNPSTTISYSLSDNIQNPQIEIYNVRGQKVRSFELENTIGENSIIWNGKDSNNKSVSSGVYFYNLINDGKTVQSRKMLMIKQRKGIWLKARWLTAACTQATSHFPLFAT